MDPRPVVPDSVEERLQLVPEPRGELRLWAFPERGLKYVIGIDTSGGGPQGDWACASIVETLTRALVGRWKGKYDPTDWGRMCARLGWYFNTALLAFETHPSQHGLSAALAARDYGYPLLYRRLQETSATHQMTNELGWATTTRTRGLMVDYARVALKEGYDVPDIELLQELTKGKYGEDGKIKWEGHDDYYVSWAIALRVADLMVERGFVSAKEPDPQNWTEEWWRRRKEQLELGTPSGRNRMRVWDGN